MFGYGKPAFDKSDKKWIQLQHKIAWKIDTLSIYPFIIVKCPHCNAINLHNIHLHALNRHQQCQLQRYQGIQVDYECPGYYIGIVTD
jgi:hypothetical protein